MPSPIRVLVWNEYRHEREEERSPRSTRRASTAQSPPVLQADPDFTVGTATLDEPEHGLTDDVLAATDVLVWWGHMRHDDVRDETVVDRVQRRVLDGMGMVVLHSGPLLEDLQALMGTTCEPEVAGGRRQGAALGRRTRPPDRRRASASTSSCRKRRCTASTSTSRRRTTSSSSAGSPAARSSARGCCYQRGAGKIFYFRPGHERHPTYYKPDDRPRHRNAVRWAAPVAGPRRVFDNVPALETI